LLCGVLLTISFSAARTAADAASPARSQTGFEAVDQAWLERLERRLARLVPVVMSSLAAARREQNPLLIRCFDRTVSALHGTGRQLRYHAEQWHNERSHSERRRHENALRLLRLRVDDLARMPELCFTDGVALRSGETRVEVERSRN
jgi:hypothetical protein